MTILIIWKQTKKSSIVFDRLIQNFVLDSLCKNLGVKFDILMIVLGFVHLTKVVVSYFCFVLYFGPCSNMPSYKVKSHTWPWLKYFEHGQKQFKLADHTVISEYFSLKE